MTNNKSYFSSLLIAGAASLITGCASMPTPIKVIATPIAVVRDAGDLLLSPIAYGTQQAGDYLDFDGKIRKIEAKQRVLQAEIERNRRQDELLNARRVRQQKELERSLGMGSRTTYDSINDSLKSSRETITPTYSSSSSYSSPYSRPSRPSFSPSYGYSTGGNVNGAELISGVSKLISGIFGGVDYVLFRSFCGGVKGKSPWKKPTESDESDVETESWGNFLFPNTRAMWAEKKE